MLLYIIKYFLSTIYHKYKLAKFRFSWIQNNKQNKTIPVNVFDPKNITVGRYTYGPIDVLRWGSDNEGLQVGNFCSIASGVKFILGGNHNIKGISTFPLEFHVLNGKEGTLSKGPIVIEDNVWIGTDSIILSGVTIGTGSVIAAGSVVSKNVEPYSIVGGNPAKLIKKRFNDEIINHLEGIDTSLWDKEYISRNKDILLNTIEDIYKLKV